MLRILLCTLAAVALLTLPPPVSVADSQESPVYAKARDKGRALMAKGKFEAAIKHLKKAEGHAGEPPVELLLDLAVCYNNLGDPSSTEPYARRALAAATEPADRARAANNLGISLFLQAKASFLPGETTDRDRGKILEEAELAFMAVLEATGGRGIALYNLAEVLKRRGRREEAKAAFAEYLETSPDGAQAAGARRALEWLACEESFSGPGPAGEGVSNDLPIGPLPVGGEVMPPVKVHAPQPPSLEGALRAGVRGTMSFEAIIDKNGDVQCVDVLEGLPNGLSEEAAGTVKQWKFEPATLHGEPVVVRFNLSINIGVR
ncbi:MAG: tetratricopeptide repeat protein [bacterium]|nr:tetratricopeptide repeat protein [bacterium]